ncbi:hypothetical protein ACPC27_32835 [Streptomyces cellulosae]
MSTSPAHLWQSDVSVICLVCRGYGTPGIARALQLAAVALNDNTARRLAEGVHVRPLIRTGPDG